MDIKGLVGETLTDIDVDPEKDEIMLTTQSGRIILICHHQECCESVRIQDTEGNWREIIGKVIVEASHEETYETESDKGCDHRTDTALTFKVDGATVISRWIGEPEPGGSNGYYSESVRIDEISQPASSPQQDGTLTIKDTVASATVRENK